MFLRHLALHDFRNLERIEVELGAGRWFILGRNGQGKTSLLEAVGLATALRSFRGADTRTLVRHGCREAVVRQLWEADAADAKGGATSLSLGLRPGAREVLLDGARLERLGDLIGRFPTVVLSSHDLHLVRGSPADRRRFLDLLLASLHPDYFEALQRYQRALDGRNRLLRDAGDDVPDEAQLDSFEAPLAAAAATLCRIRLERVPLLQERARVHHARFADAGESLGVALGARSAFTTETEWREKFAATRGRDLAAGGTNSGPHRDDLLLTLGGHDAADFSSEGQQRSIVLALKLAQFSLLAETSGRTPVLLADDVLGELDPLRRERFWRALPANAQILASGTETPADAGAWSVLYLEAGALTRA